MDLSGRGVWFYPDGLSSDDCVDFAKRIESMGYTALWLPEAGGRDPFALAARLLDHTTSLVVATGVANIYARDAGAMKAAQYTLAEQSGGRFLLGIGVSHRLLVEDMRGHVYGKPIGTMTAYLDALDTAPYVAVPPAEEPPTLLAALGPKMLALARDRADGAHPYMVTPEHTRRAREVLGPDRMLCTEQKVVIESDRPRGRSIARSAAALEMGLTLPNYQRNLMRLGFEAKDFEDGLSDRLVDAIVAMGEVSEVEARLAEHEAAGADHVCIHPLHPEGKSEPDWHVLEALAPGG